uniref:BHLH transcription factor n=1 Tax=Dracaena cambodiana TaxID=580341 RepID=A0A7M3UQH3_9ASPA|nr:bHLH transcription factor [Dracaena cambodiana]
MSALGNDIFCASTVGSHLEVGATGVLSIIAISRKVENDAKDPIAARKIQKADREKLRRDRLNEQFMELGKALDPDRPKNDKATILSDTIQMLKDLTTQVNKLKTEYTSLSEEERELTQEKNELREEKATLKSEIDNLNSQYQQRLRCVYPWAALDPSVVMAPTPPYPYPVPVPVPSAPIPIHPLQPYPFFQNQTSGAQSSAQRPSHPHPGASRSQTSSRQDSGSKSLDLQQHSGAERSDDFSDLVTELELKTPGSVGASSHPKAAKDQDLSSEGSKGKQWPPQRKASSDNGYGNSSSRCSSSSSGLPGSSSNSVVDGSVANN